MSVRNISAGIMESTYPVLKAILKPWLATWFRWHIEGLEQHPQERDPPSWPSTTSRTWTRSRAAYVVDKAKRVPRFLAKHELFEDKRIAWMLRGAGQIPVKRGSADGSDGAGRSRESAGPG